MKFTNFKISRECIFPIDNVAHVCSRKTFYHISINFQNPGFRSVSKARKPVFITPLLLLSPMVSGWAGGRREIVCPGCISETVRCRKFILGRDIGWGGVGVQRHGLTLI